MSLSDAVAGPDPTFQVSSSSAAASLVLNNASLSIDAGQSFTLNTGSAPNNLTIGSGTSITGAGMFQVSGFQSDAFGAVISNDLVITNDGTIDVANFQYYMGNFWDGGGTTDFTIPDMGGATGNVYGGNLIIRGSTVASSATHWRYTLGGDTTVGGNLNLSILDSADLGGTTLSLLTSSYDLDVGGDFNVGSSLGLNVEDLARAVNFTGGTGALTIAGDLNISEDTLETVTFDASNVNYDLDIDGNFTLTGGTFLAPDISDTSSFMVGGNWEVSGDGTFTSNGGMVMFDATDTDNTIVTTSTNADDFNRAMFRGSGTGKWTLSDDLTALSVLTVQQGTLDTSIYTLNAGSITVSSFGTLDASDVLSNLDITNDVGIYEGSFLLAPAALDDTSFTVGRYWTISSTGTFTHNNGRVVFDGTVPLNTITTESTNADDFYDLKFNGVGGEWDLFDDLTVLNDLTITNGTFDLNGQNLDLTGATFTNDGTLALKGTETLTNFTNDIDSGKITYNGTGATGLITGNTYYDLEFAGSNTYTLDAALDVNNDFSLSAGTFDVATYDINVGGDWSQTDPSVFVPNTQTVIFDATDTGHTIATNSNGADDFYNLTFNGAGGGWTLSDGLTVLNDLTVTAGTLDTSDKTVAINSDLLITGGMLDASDASSNLDIDGNFTLTGGTFIAPATLDASFYVGGNWEVSGDGTFTHSNGKVVLDTTDTDSTIVTTSTNADDFYSLLLYANGESGKWTLSDDLTAFDVVMSYGTLDTSTYTFNVSDDLSVFGSILDASDPLSNLYVGDNFRIDFDAVVLAPSALDDTSFTVGGSWTVTQFGTFTHNNGRVVFDGTSSGKTITTDSTNADDFYDLKFNGSGGIWTLSDDLTVLNDLTVVDGTLDTSTANFNINNDLNISGGMLDASDATSDIDVDGNFTLTGGTLLAPATIDETSFTVGGNWEVSGDGTFTHNNGIVVFDATDTDNVINTTSSNADDFYYLKFNGSGGKWTLGDDLIVANTIAISQGTFDTSTSALGVNQNLVISGGILDASDVLSNLDIDGNVALLTGTLLAPAVADDTSFTVGGSWNVTGDGTFTHNNGRVVFDATDAGHTIVSTSSNADDFYDLKFNGSGGRWALSDDLAITNNLAIDAGIFDLSGQNLDLTGATFSNDDVLILQGDETLTNFTNDTNSGWILYDGTGTYNSLIAGTDYYNLGFWSDGGGGIWSLGAGQNLDVNATLSIVAGSTFDLNGQNLDLTGATFGNEGILSLEGTETLTNFANDTDSGKILYDGTGASGLITGNTYYDLEFSGSNTYTLDADLVVNNDFSLTSGTLDTDRFNLNVNRNLAVSGGVLDASHSNADLDIDGDFSLVSGTFLAPTVGDNTSFYVGGNWEVSGDATFTHNNGGVVFDGADDDFTIITTSTNADDFYDLYTNGSNVTWTLSDDLIVTNDIWANSGIFDTSTFNLNVGRDLIVSNSTLDASDALSNLDIGSDVHINSSGILIAPAALDDTSFTVGDSFYVDTTGTFTHSSGRVVFNATDTDNIISTGANPLFYVDDFYDIKFDGLGGEWSMSKDLTVTNGLTITNGLLYLNGYDLDLTGATFSNLGTFSLDGDETLVNFTNDTDSGKILYNGTGATGLIAGNTYYDLEFSGSSGYTLDATLDVNNDLTVASGALDTSTYDLNINNDLNIFGGIFDASDALSDLDIDGDVTVTSGGLFAPSALDDTSFTVGGNWEISVVGSFVHNDGRVVFDASDTGHTIVTTSFNADDFYDLKFNGIGGDWALSDDLAVTNALTITNGILDLNGQNLDLTGATFSNDDTLILQGDETLTNFTNDTNSGTIAYSGVNTYTSLAAGDSYYNLQFTGSGDYTLDAALDVNNDFSLSGGTLDVATYDINVGGGWSQTGSSIFTPNSQAVTFDGTSGSHSILTNSSGADDFYDLNISGSGGTWQLSDELTVTNTFGLTAGTFDMGTSDMNVGGSWWQSGSSIFTPNSQTVTLDGAGSFGIWTNSTGADDFYDLTINGVGGLWTLADGLTVLNGLAVANGTLDTLTRTLNVSGGLSVMGGILDASDALSNLNIDGDVFLVSGTVLAPSVLDDTSFTVGGQWFQSVMGEFIHNSGRVVFDATDTLNYITTDSSNADDFYDLTFNGVGGGWKLGDGLNVLNDLTVANGTLDTGVLDINVNQNLNISGGMLDASDALSDLDIDGDVIVTGGTLSAPAALDDTSFIVGLNWEVSGDGTFTHNNGRVVFDVFNSSTITTSSTNADDFYDLKISREWSSWTLADDLTVLNDLDLLTGFLFTSTYALNINRNLQISFGLLDASDALADLDIGASVSISSTGSLSAPAALDDTSFTVGGSWNVSDHGTFTHNNGRVVFDSTINNGWGISTTSTNTDDFYDLKFNAVDEWTLSDDLTVLNNLFIADGTLDTSTYNLDVNSSLFISGGILDASDALSNLDIGSNVMVSSGTLLAPAVLDDTSFRVGGGWSFYGDSTFTHNNGRVVFDATDTGHDIVTTSSNADDFYDLKFNGAGGGWALGYSLTVLNDLTITAGTFDVTLGGLNLNSDLLINGGTLDASDALTNLDIDGDVTITSGTLSAPTALDDTSFTVGGDWEVSGDGTFTHNDGRVFFDETGVFNTMKTTSSNADDFYDIKFNNDKIWVLTDDLIVLNDLHLADGYLVTDVYDLDINRDLDISGGNLNASDAASDLDIDRDVTITSGTLSAPTALDDTSFTVGGNWEVSSDGTFTHNDGRVVLDATDTGNTIVTTSTNDDDFYDLKFNGVGGGWNQSDRMYLSNDLTISNGTLTLDAGRLIVGNSLNLSGGNLNATDGSITTHDLIVTAGDFIAPDALYNPLLVSGNWEVSGTGTYDNNNTWVGFNGSGSGHTIISGGYDFYNTVFSEDNEWTLGDDFVATYVWMYGSKLDTSIYNVTAGSFWQDGGTFDASDAASDINIDGDFALIGGTFLAPAVLDDTSFMVGGDWEVSGDATFTQNNGRVVLDASDTDNTVVTTSTNADDFYDLKVNGAGGKWALSDDLTVINDLAILDGTLEILTNALNINSDLVVDGGNLDVSDAAGSLNVDGTVTVLSGGILELIIEEMEEALQTDVADTVTDLGDVSESAELPDESQDLQSQYQANKEASEDNTDTESSPSNEVAESVSEPVASSETQTTTQSQFIDMGSEDDYSQSEETIEIVPGSFSTEAGPIAKEAVIVNGSQTTTVSGEESTTKVKCREGRVEVVERVPDQEAESQATSDDASFSENNPDDLSEPQGSSESSETQTEEQTSSTDSYVSPSESQSTTKSQYIDMGSEDDYSQSEEKIQILPGSFSTEAGPISNEAIVVNGSQTTTVTGEESTTKVKCREGRVEVVERVPDQEAESQATSDDASFSENNPDDLSESQGSSESSETQTEEQTSSADSYTSPSETEVTTQSQYIDMGSEADYVKSVEKIRILPGSFSANVGPIHKESIIVNGLQMTAVIGESSLTRVKCRQGRVEVVERVQAKETTTLNETINFMNNRS